MASEKFGAPKCWGPMDIVHPCPIAVTPLLRESQSRLVFKYHNKIGSKLINNNPQPVTSCGVYKIPCGDCPKFYIGETGRDLSVRIKEHVKDIEHNKPESGVVTHVNATGHYFDFAGANIIFPSNNLQKRHLVESALIKTNNSHVTNLNLGKCPQGAFISKFICKPFQIT